MRLILRILLAIIALLALLHVIGESMGKKMPYSHLITGEQQPDEHGRYRH